MGTEKNNHCIVEDHGFEQLEQILAVIGGKWKIQIIYHLGQKHTLRYGQLKRLLPEISHKVLSAQLKDLEKSGLIQRIEYLEIPLRVEYLLTESGVGLIPVYEAMSKWCEENSSLLQNP
ncbi:winged helix-turn-helix transcriptional regulator [Enterococcus sp. AZ109]|uniref:winged helix-turn-helix transcriptional regulator n=1 Tax=Enterococcus sp. AZ109 TaxID=2774634 RepID=UPI003F20DF5E